MDLNSSVTSISGIGSILAGKLAVLGVNTILDLLYHLPFRYEDRSTISAIGLVQPGETITVTGSVREFKSLYTRSRKTIQSAIIEDESGQISATWFNQPFLSQTLRPNTPVALYGKVGHSGSKIALISPDYELTFPNRPRLHTGRIVPVYPETAGVSSK